MMMSYEFPSNEVNFAMAAMPPCHPSPTHSESVTIPAPLATEQIHHPIKTEDLAEAGLADFVYLFNDMAPADYSDDGGVPATPPTRHTPHHHHHHSSSGGSSDEEGSLWFEESPGQAAAAAAAAVVPDLQAVVPADELVPETASELLQAYVFKTHLAPADLAQKRVRSLTVDLSKQTEPRPRASGGDSPGVVIAAAPAPAPKSHKKKGGKPMSEPRAAAAAAPKATRPKSAAKASKPTKAAKKAAAAAAAAAIKCEDEPEGALSPVAEARRKKEGNRRAAKKFRMKQKAKEQEMMDLVVRLEVENARLAAELALIKALR